MMAGSQSRFRWPYPLRQPRELAEGVKSPEKNAGSSPFALPFGGRGLRYALVRVRQRAWFWSVILSRQHALQDLDSPPAILLLLLPKPWCPRSKVFSGFSFP